jgi:hypothetical protein
LLILCEYLPARREVWLMVQVVGLCCAVCCAMPLECCMMQT